MATPTTYRQCERCLVDTDHWPAQQIELFEDCPVCRGIWLCASCAQIHRDELTIFGGAR